MNSEPRQEGATDAPDRFYLNEMKREIADTAQFSPSAELYNAFDLVDVDSLKRMIAEADGLPPSQYVHVMNSHGQLKNKLWNYMNDSFAEVQQRRGYAPNDFRGLTVSLSSACVRLAMVVDRAKIDVLGRAASTDFTNSLTTSLFTEVAKGLVGANEHAISPGSASFVASLSDDAFNKTGMERGDISWSWAKTHNFAESLRGFLSLHEILTNLPDISQGDIEMLRRQNDELGEASESLKTYTPKPAIGTLEGTNVQTLFVDQEVHSHVMISSSPRARHIPVKLFPGTDLTNSNVELVHKRAHKNEGGAAKRIIVEGMDKTVSHCDVVIYDGKALGMGGYYLEDFAKAIGAEGQLALLTSMLLSQNFDLTVPSYVVDLADEEARTMERNEEHEPMADKLRRLLVARTRVLNTLGDDIHEALEKDDLDSSERHKHIINHGVVGHLRRLPEGYSPSQAAHDLCREQLGVEIPEGHTYVKIHRRGDIVLPDRGHKMSKNSNDLGRLSVSQK